MELKLVILSLACLSCLVPPSLGTSLLAAKAALGLKGAAVLGAGALAAKGLALKGAAVVGAKVAAAKLLAAKVAGHGALVAAKPQIQVQHIPQSTVVLSPPSLSKIKDRVVNLISTAHTAALNKKAAVSDLLLSLLPTKTIVQPPKVEVVEVPRVLEVVDQPCPPSVAVIGPTMHVL